VNDISILACLLSWNVTSHEGVELSRSVSFMVAFFASSSSDARQKIALSFLSSLSQKKNHNIINPNSNSHILTTKMSDSKGSSKKEEDSSSPQKKPRRTSDRVVLDVGGTKFVSAISTLTANSAYFQSTFSVQWQAERDEELATFLDQDPAPFYILLGYMRSRLINVNDVNAGVLAQVEFLGIEELLAAVKVRAYLNLHPNFNHFWAPPRRFDTTKGCTEGVRRANSSSF
jgi:hypothetical protein